MRTLLHVLCATLVLLGGMETHCLAAQEPILKTAWLGEHEAFPAWYAQQQGWDTEAGFSLELIPFASGRDLIAGKEEKKWVIAGCGALPALTANLETPLEIIAIGNDESAATGIYTRKESPLLGTTGYNPSFPDVAGSISSIRGKTVLCPAKSAAEFTVSRWLGIFGLSEKDIALKNMPPEKALEAFLAGEGDAVALWSPYTHEAEQSGLKPVAMSSECGASQPTLIIADQTFAQSHPQEIVAFLKMYFRGIQALKDTPRERLIEQYKLFYHAWTGRDLPPQAAAWELANHAVYTLQEQLDLFDSTKNSLRNWLHDLAVFYGGDNRLGSVTDTYLKATAAQKTLR